jgi:hypothetical protein
MIHVHRRANAYQDRARAYKILLDGQEVGNVKRGESAAFDAAPGAHELQLKIDWATSEPVSVEVQAGQDVHFNCWPNAKPLTALYWITVGRSRYIGVEEVAGPPQSSV